MSKIEISSLELCAGGGGQALGLEQAGFLHAGLVENDRNACATLRYNRPKWNVIQQSLEDFEAAQFRGVDIVSGGVPCPPFSRAGAQLGRDDERDMFPHATRVALVAKPRAIIFENVRGFLDARFSTYRKELAERLIAGGYILHWRLLTSADFGVAQLRPRAIGVALKEADWKKFRWPARSVTEVATVGETLFPAMASAGWEGAEAWRQQAMRIGPTLVGGSKKHGGADLGPTRAKREWARLKIDALVLADSPPPAAFSGMPRLTIEMVALLQGFPRDWRFLGGKTAAYRQVGNAFPPPVAKAVGLCVGRVFVPTRRLRDYDAAIADQGLRYEEPLLRV